MKRAALLICIGLLGASCSDGSDSGKLEALREKVAELEEAVPVAPSSSETERLGMQTTVASGSSEIERLEAEVDDLRDRLEEAGLVEPTVTLGVDPPPSDELIGFWKGEEIFVMDPYGRHVRQVTGHSEHSYQPDFVSVPKWSPDGTRLIYVLNGDLYVINTDGTGGHWLNVAQSCGMARVPSWSPDGERVLFACGSSDIYVVDADGTNLRQLTERSDDNAIDKLYNMDASWSPDGQYISYRQQVHPFLDDWYESIVFLSFPEGEEVDRSFPFPMTHSVIGRPVIWNPAGGPNCRDIICLYKIAYVASKDGETNQVFTQYFHAGSSIKRLVGTGHDPSFKQHTDSAGWKDAPVWSPDGDFAYVGETVDGPELFEGFHQSTRRPRQLTNNLVRDGDPVWSPDGKKIAHTSERDGASGIYVMDAGDGGNILSTGQSGIPWGWISTG